MWVNLLAVGVGWDVLGKKPSAFLPALWKQLKPEQENIKNKKCVTSAAKGILATGLYQETYNPRKERRSFASFQLRGRLKCLHSGDKQGSETPCWTHYTLVTCKCTEGICPVGVEAECNPVHGNPDRFLGQVSYIDGYGGKTITIQVILHPWKLCIFPLRYTLCTSPWSLNIYTGVDILLRMHIRTSIGEFHLQVRGVKSVVSPTLKLYQLPGGYDEITSAIHELEKVET